MPGVHKHDQAPSGGKNQHAQDLSTLNDTTARSTGTQGDPIRRAKYRLISHRMTTIGIFGGECLHAYVSCVAFVGHKRAITSTSDGIGEDGVVLLNSSLRPKCRRLLENLRRSGNPVDRNVTVISNGIKTPPPRTIRV